LDFGKYSATHRKTRRKQLAQKIRGKVREIFWTTQKSGCLALISWEETRESLKLQMRGGRGLIVAHWLGGGHIGIGHINEGNLCQERENKKERSKKKRGKD